MHGIWSRLRFMLSCIYGCLGLNGEDWLLCDDRQSHPFNLVNITISFDSKRSACKDYCFHKTSTLTTELIGQSYLRTGDLWLSFLNKHLYMSIYLTIKIYVLTTIITQPTQPALFYCARPIRVNGMCDPSYSCQIRIRVFLYSIWSLRT